VDISLRPLDRDDIPAWARLLADTEKVDNTGEHFSVADLEEEMDNPDVEVGKDFVGAFDGEDLVGYFSVMARGEAEGVFKVHVQGSVLPDRRGEGIGSVLATAMVDRGRAAALERRPDLPCRLTATGMSTNAEQEHLLTSHGMRGERWNFVMRTRVDDLPPAQPLPDGYEFRRYDDAMGLAVLEAHNLAFGGHHPNFTPWTETMWKQWVTGSHTFRPDTSRVVVPTGSDEIVAYLTTHEFEAYFEATGRREAYVGKVGTLPEHRGRGIAAALLGHCLHAYAEAGYDEASLDVDSENPTGALGVYQRAGFAVESRWTNYFLTLPV
jgi:mycothiol synthase